jgi:hypothetical protein
MRESSNLDEIEDAQGQRLRGYCCINQTSPRPDSGRVDEAFITRRQQVRPKTTRPVPSYGDIEENPTGTYDFQSKLLTTEQGLITMDSLLHFSDSGYSRGGN